MVSLVLVIESVLPDSLHVEEVGGLRQIFGI